MRFLFISQIPFVCSSIVHAHQYNIAFAMFHKHRYKKLFASLSSIGVIFSQTINKLYFFRFNYSSYLKQNPYYLHYYSTRFVPLSFLYCHSIYDHTTIGHIAINNYYNNNSTITIGDMTVTQRTHHTPTTTARDDNNEELLTNTRLTNKQPNEQWKSKKSKEILYRTAYY